MRKILKSATIILLITVGLAVVVFLLPNLALGAELDVGLEYAEDIGLGDTDPRIIAARIIRVALGFLGLLAVGLFLYGGWLWMTSEGNDEQIAKAKTVLKNAIIGILIIMSAFSIVSFIINRLLGAMDGQGIGGDGGPGYRAGITALGSNIVSSHYPSRNATGIARNTKIVISFKESMDASTIINDTNGSGVLGDWVDANGDEKIDDGEYDEIKTAIDTTPNILIYKSNDGSEGPFVTKVIARKTQDNKTFNFKPVQYLGSPSEDVWYTVALSKNLLKANGDSAFSGAVGAIGYDWSFKTGTQIDTTPPRVKSIVPQPAASEPRNVVIQVNFNEAVDPIAASGNTDSFNNIIVNDNGSLVAGNFYISNGYKTIEFLTGEACGKNSCGQTIYCLPAGGGISVLVKAATLVVVGGSEAIFPYDGVVDMADNSFDGNKNGVSEGPQLQSSLPPYNENDVVSLSSDEIITYAGGHGDDYTWSFTTTNEIVLEPSIIEAISPDINENSVSLNTVPEARFDKLLMSSSLRGAASLDSSGGDIDYWVAKSNSNNKTTIFIKHDQFNEETDYYPQFNSGIKDIYQNCYSPCSGLGVIGAPSCCNGAPDGGSSCY